jgi:hypothetical protein
MAHLELTPRLALLEEAVSVLFRRIDDAYNRLNPKGAIRRPSKNSRTRRSSPSPPSSSLEGWSPSVASCARSAGSSRICSLGWSAFTPPGSTGGYASSGATSSPCAAPSCPNS